MQTSVQELVNRGTVLGARDQILVVSRHITTQDICWLLYLQGRRPEDRLQAGARRGPQMKTTLGGSFKVKDRPEVQSGDNGAGLGAHGRAHEVTEPGVPIPLGRVKGPIYYPRDGFCHCPQDPTHWDLGL